MFPLITKRITLDYNCLPDTNFTGIGTRILFLFWVFLIGLFINKIAFTNQYDND